MASIPTSIGDVHVRCLSDIHPRAGLFGPRVEAVQQLYEGVLLRSNPTPPQLKWRRSRFSRGLKLFREIEPMVGPLSGRRLLDLGAAHGGDSSAAVALGMDVCMADWSDHDYAALSERLGRFARVDWRLFDFNADWPLPDASFDGVLAMAVIEHIPDLNRFFSQMRRVTRPGGFGIVQVGMALPTMHCDGLFQTPGTSLLPMCLRRWTARVFFDRSYRWPVANRTFYTVRPVARGAARAGFSASPYKYADSPVMSRVGAWPAADLWRRLVVYTCADYVLLRQPR